MKFTSSLLHPHQRTYPEGRFGFLMSAPSRLCHCHMHPSITRNPTPETELLGTPSLASGKVFAPRGLAIALHLGLDSGPRKVREEVRRPSEQI